MGLFFGRKKRQLEEEQWNDWEHVYDKSMNNYDRDEFMREGAGSPKESAGNDFQEDFILKNKDEKLTFVEDCCEQIIEAAKRCADAKKEYKAVNGYLEDIRLIKEQDLHEREELERIARRIINLKSDKESYRTFGTKIPETMYYYMEKNEKEMPDILKELHDDENREQSLKTDLNNIEGEKAALLYERKEYLGRLGGIRNGALVCTLTAAAALGVMFYLHLNSDYDYTIGILLTVAILAVILTGIVLCYQKYIREIKLTEKKINKAVGLLNKYRLLYVNVKNSVDYTYHKLQIHSTYELSNYWRLYLTAKKEQQAYTQMSEELYREQQKFNDKIHALNLYDESVWSYQMGAIAEEGAMQEIVDNLEKRREGLRKTIDFNKKRSEKCKQKVKNIIKTEPSLAADILKIVEEKEKGEFV